MRDSIFDIARDQIQVGNRTQTSRERPKPHQCLACDDAGLIEIAEHPHYVRVGMDLPGHERTAALGPVHPQIYQTHDRPIGYARVEKPLPPGRQLDQNSSVGLDRLLAIFLLWFRAVATHPERLLSSTTNIDSISKTHKSFFYSGLCSLLLPDSNKRPDRAVRAAVFCQERRFLRVSLGLSMDDSWRASSPIEVSTETGQAQRPFPSP